MAAEVKVVDGGLATEIERRGFSIHDDPLWSARLLHTNPSAIRQVHESYLNHGADIIITASYQASIGGLCEHLCIDESEALQLIQLSVTLAKEAGQNVITSSNDRIVPIVAGSVGPYGACQHDGSEYHGNYVDHMTSEELMEWHRPRVRELLASGADILACETIPAKAEAEALVILLRDFPDAKAWVTFTCKDDLHTCHGELFSEAVSSVAESPQVTAVGVNCTHPKHVEPHSELSVLHTPVFCVHCLEKLGGMVWDEVTKHLHEALLESAQGKTHGKPFVIYPNSGEDWSRENGWFGSGGMEGFLPAVPRWVELGARMIGGCCRVGPQDIQLIRQCVDSLQTKG